jgi:hypothetical protein
MQWSITVPPSTAVCTWQQLKDTIRPVSPSEQSFIMDTLLPEATEQAGEWMQAIVLPSTITAIYQPHDLNHHQFWWEWEYNLYHRGRPLELPRGPVISITSVIDTNGNAIAKLLGRRWDEIGQSTGSTSKRRPDSREAKGAGDTQAVQLWEG